VRRSSVCERHDRKIKYEALLAAELGSPGRRKELAGAILVQDRIPRLEMLVVRLTKGRNG
jgi:hypothetical protein